MTRFEHGADEFELPQANIIRITEGLGFGSGTISGNTEHEPPEVVSVIENDITDVSKILVSVDHDSDGNVLDDDGCGDGRCVELVFSGDKSYKRSLNRAKVFGGGLTMMAASRIGLGLADGRTLTETFGDARSHLADKNISYGAHTDSHASGPNCGCGAIDKAPLIIEAITQNESEIVGTIEALGIASDGLEEILASYREYARQIDGATDYSGKAVMDTIVGDGKVVKQLGGEHKERYIILNTVAGTTVNQSVIRDDSGEAMQVFATDVWRLQAIARRAYDDETTQHKAFLSELVYTLGTAATLTKGDLPVYVASPQETDISVAA